MCMNNVLVDDSRLQRVLKPTALQHLKDTSIGSVIQAYGIYLRLCSKIPVLLVGDLQQRYEQLRRKRTAKVMVC